MPQYIDHPVKNMKTWEENVKWRLDPKSPGRYADLENRMGKAQIEAAKGKIITQDIVGGYMYLRSLIGPEELFYAFYEMPEVIHECMKAWFELSDYIIAQHQQYVTIDEIFLDEDICFNLGPFISPDMMKEFLFPYYQQQIGLNVMSPFEVASGCDVVEIGKSKINRILIISFSNYSKLLKFM